MWDLFTQMPLALYHPVLKKRVPVVAVSKYRRGVVFYPFSFPTPEDPYPGGHGDYPVHGKPRFADNAWHVDDENGTYVFMLPNEEEQKAFEVAQAKGYIRSREYLDEQAEAYS